MTAKKCAIKRGDARAELLFCQSKPLFFLPFSLTLPSSLLKLPNIDRCRVYLLNNIQYYLHNKLYFVCTCVSSYLLQQGITIQTAGLSLQTLCRDRRWKWCTERNFTEASRGRVSNYITCICNTILVYILCPSLWKQLVLCNASTSFPAKWCLWNNCRSSILMIIHSAYDSHSAFCKIPLLWSYW